MILYMYIAPGQGQTTSWRQNFDVNRKALYHVGHLLQVQKKKKKKKKSLSTLTLFIFFSCFYSCIYPWGKHRQLLGTKFRYQYKPFITLVICCKFLPLKDFLTFSLKSFPYKNIRKQIWPWRKKVKVNPRSSFEQTLLGPSPQCCTPSPHVIGPLVPEKKIF